MWFYGVRVVIFFVKQKTAYELRIRDCSADVCSSDLPPIPSGVARIVTDDRGRPLVIGLNRDALIRQFGTPVAEREASPARVLEFRHENCLLAAYLYFDTARNDFYALQYEVNGSVDTNYAADR